MFHAINTPKSERPRNAQESWHVMPTGKAKLHKINRFFLGCSPIPSNRCDPQVVIPGTSIGVAMWLLWLLMIGVAISNSHHSPHIFTNFPHHFPPSQAMSCPLWFLRAGARFGCCACPSSEPAKVPNPWGPLGIVGAGFATAGCLGMSRCFS